MRIRADESRDLHRVPAAGASAWSATAHAAAAPEPAEETAAPPAGDASEADAAAKNGDADAGELAKQVQNPIANLISVPFQENLGYNIGPYERASSTLNIQPVIPVKLTPDWMLITRTIVPLVYQPDVNNTGGGSSGLGDINPAFFFSPVEHGPLMWGMGPAFLLPTATQRATRHRKVVGRRDRRRACCSRASGRSACSPAICGRSPVPTIAPRSTR